MRLVFFWPSPGAFAEPTWRFSNPTGLLHVASTAAWEHTALDPLPGLCNTIFPVVSLQIVLPHIPACRPLSSAAKSVSCGPSTTNAKVACSAGCENPASLSPVGAEGYFPILPMASWLFPLCSVSLSPPRPPQILTTALPPCPVVLSASPRLPRYTTGSSLMGPCWTPLLISHPTAPPLGRKHPCFLLPSPLLLFCPRLTPLCQIQGLGFQLCSSLPCLLLACAVSIPLIRPHYLTPLLLSNLSLLALETIYFNRCIP